jgi:hypothetical protein
LVLRAGLEPTTLCWCNFSWEYLFEAVQ